MTYHISYNDAVQIADYFEDYYEHIENIEDYLRRIKLERIQHLINPLPGMGMGDELFSEYDMEPKDMDFEVRVADKRFDDLLEITTSHAVEKSSPGRQLRLFVFEKNTNKIAGFLRVGSLVINCKPRNEYLGKPVASQNKDAMFRFNHHMLCGQVIVPVQPFGYNALAGKLMALTATSNEVKEIYDDKFKTDICFFETTSLYGSTKGASMYDGLKPWMRYKGNTESDFAPLLNDGKFAYIKTLFEDRAGEKLTTNASSKKLSYQTKIISTVKQTLKENPERQKQFVDAMNAAKELTEKKRVYIGDYGFTNTPKVIHDGDTPIAGPDRYKWDLDYIIPWWKKHAQKRVEKLKEEGRYRTEPELWTETENIQIIR